MDGLVLRPSLRNVIQCAFFTARADVKRDHAVAAQFIIEAACLQCIITITSMDLCE